MKDSSCTGKSESSLEVVSAVKFIERFRGLLPYKSIPDNFGMLFRKCSAVHTFGMKFQIDVIFICRRGTVCRIDTLPPSRISYCRKATHVIEINAGASTRYDIRPGEVIWDKITIL